MDVQRVGIIVNGATGGIARRQHLRHALLPIIAEGGVRSGETLIRPELLLVARNAEKLAALAAKLGIERWTTDLAAALAEPGFSVFFDAGHTGGRAPAIRAAIAAGKHVYSEKPVVTNLDEGRTLLDLARTAGIKFGVVEDKLALPGLVKIRELVRSGFFGTITGFSLSLGYWFFTGYDRPDPRGSWTYKAAEGGGLVTDMYPHWRYIVEGILGPIGSLVSRAWTGVPRRLDEAGEPYVADADDFSVTVVEMELGAIGTISTSVATRVREDDLLTFKIDGTGGSAVAGLHRCYVQTADATPQAVFDPMEDRAVDYREHWQVVRDTAPLANGYRLGWEAFLRQVACDTPLEADLGAGLRDVAFAEAVLASSAKRRWMSLSDFAPQC